jgi:hypothetical protein
MRNLDAVIRKVNQYTHSRYTTLIVPPLHEETRNLRDNRTGESPTADYTQLNYRLYGSS